MWNSLHCTPSKSDSQALSTKNYSHSFQAASNTYHYWSWTFWFLHLFLCPLGLQNSKTSLTNSTGKCQKNCPAQSHGAHNEWDISPGTLFFSNHKDYPHSKQFFLLAKTPFCQKIILPLIRISSIEVEVTYLAHVDSVGRKSLPTSQNQDHKLWVHSTELVFNDRRKVLLMTENTKSWQSASSFLTVTERVGWRSSRRRGELQGTSCKWEKRSL